MVKMNNKEDYISEMLLCGACLCFGRNLYVVKEDKLRQYYINILKEIPLYNTVMNCPSVCIECITLLKKAIKFREQVQDSYRILQTYTSENINEYLLTDVSRPPRFDVYTIEPIDIPPIDTNIKNIDIECSQQEDSVRPQDMDIKIEVKNECTPGIEKDCLSMSDGSSDKEAMPVTMNKTMKKNALSSVKDELQIKNEDAEVDSISLSCPSSDEGIAKLEKRIQSVLSGKKRRDSDRVKVKKLRVRKKKNVTSFNEYLPPDGTRPPRAEVYTEEPPMDNIIKTVQNVSVECSQIEDEKPEILDVKFELKNDCIASDENLDSLSCPSSDEDIAKFEKRIQSVLSRKKKRDNDRVKVKKLKVRKKKDIKKSKTKMATDQQIVTIELTYEEMLQEREKEAKRESYTRAQYKCDTCLVGFNYRRSYTSHVSAKHSPDIGDYNCPICKTVLPTVESFTTHYKRHMRRYECGICQKRTMDMKVMQQHYYSTHEISLKQYTCSLCMHVSNSIDTHRYHKDTHKGRVQCPECDKSFIHRAGLMNHRLAVHECHNAFPCTVCDKVFRWKTSLKRHLEKHDIQSKGAGSTAYCSTCEVSFSSLFSYQRHLKNSLKHVTQDQLRYICDHCNKRFVDKTKLRDHIEEKHLHRTFQCHICLKPSKNRVGLDQHIRNVHRGRPNNKMCHHCGKGFPTKVQLESHIRTHTGERPFICEFCPTMFSQQSNLYKHNRQVHLNMKSKRPSVCKKSKEDTAETSSLDTSQQDPYKSVMTVLHYSPERGFCHV